MKRIAACIATLLATLGAGSPVFAKEEDDKGLLQQAVGDPEGLTLSGTIRVRYETLANQFRPGLEENADTILLRTTLAAEYATGPVRIGGELIDARAYLADRNGSVGTGEVNALELVQAYIGADLGDALGRGSTTALQVGRFTMDQGSRRLVSRNSFRNTTNAFAGIKLETRTANGSKLTLFYTLPLVRLPSDKSAILDNQVKWDRESFDFRFWGGFASHPLSGRANVEAYFYGLEERDAPRQPTRNRHLYTPGMRIYAKPAAGKWDYELEGAYQFGHLRESTDALAGKQSVSAYTLHAEAGYRFPAAWPLRLSLEYDRASGDRPGGRYGRFDNLFGSRRSDFGPTSTFGTLGRANIGSLGLRLEFEPDKRWDGFVHYSANWLDSASDSFANTGVRDPTGASGRFAGHQLEAQVRYWLLPDLLRMNLGGAVLFNGGFLKDAPNANGYGNPAFGYLELSANF